MKRIVLIAIAFAMIAFAACYAGRDGGGNGQSNRDSGQTNKRSYTYE